MLIQVRKTFYQAWSQKEDVSNVLFCELWGFLLLHLFPHSSLYLQETKILNQRVRRKAAPRVHWQTCPHNDTFHLHNCAFLSSGRSVLYIPTAKSDVFHLKFHAGILGISFRFYHLGEDKMSQGQWRNLESGQGVYSLQNDAQWRGKRA